MALPHMVWKRLLIALAVASASTAAIAADRFFVYNLTTATVFVGVYLAPIGSGAWGANQALNDKDKELDPSERLPIKGIARGRFDVRLVDAKGRICLAPEVDLTKESTFAIHDGDLTDCH